MLGKFHFNYLKKERKPPKQCLLFLLSLSDVKQRALGFFPGSGMSNVPPSCLIFIPLDMDLHGRELQSTRTRPRVYYRVFFLNFKIAASAGEIK